MLEKPGWLQSTGLKELDTIPVTKTFTFLEKYQVIRIQQMTSFLQEKFCNSEINVEFK